MLFFGVGGGFVGGFLFIFLFSPHLKQKLKYSVHWKKSLILKFSVIYFGFWVLDRNKNTLFQFYMFFISSFKYLTYVHAKYFNVKFSAMVWISEFKCEISGDLQPSWEQRAFWIKQKMVLLSEDKNFERAQQLSDTA